MKFLDPNINDEGYNLRTAAVHCCATADDGCAKPLFDRYHTFNDYVFTVWEHFGMDADGLRRIPRQTSVMYCLEHSPFANKEPWTRECIVCGKLVDRAEARSEVVVTSVGLKPVDPATSQEKSSAPTTKLGFYRQHEACAGPEFDVVKAEREKMAANGAV